MYFYIKLKTTISVGRSVIKSRHFLAVNNLVNFRNIKNAFGYLKMVLVTTNDLDYSFWCDLRGDIRAPQNDNFGTGT